MHGGRHGGWCWKWVAHNLRNRGHAVFAPTLTGLGERSHLLSPEITLETHAQDITSVIQWEDLEDVVLVGHSYGGMVISAVAQNAPDRIQHLVFLDAMLPRTGEALVDLIGVEATYAMANLVLQRGDGWFLPVNRSASDYGIDDPALAAWVDARLTPQPYSTYTDVLGSADIAWNIGATYIRCERSNSIRPEIYERARDRARHDSHFSFLDLNAGHDAMITHPDLVAEHLDSVANVPG